MQTCGAADRGRRGCFRAGVEGWTQAQKRFAAAFGASRTVELRTLLHAVATTELGANAPASGSPLIFPFCAGGGVKSMAESDDRAPADPGNC
jgi:hypothetical protein